MNLNIYYKKYKKFLFIAITVLLIIGILFLPIIPLTFTAHELISYQKESHERPIVHVATDHSLDAVYKPSGNYLKSEVTIINADHFKGEIQITHNIFIDEKRIYFKSDSLYINPGKVQTSSVLFPIGREHIGIMFTGNFSTKGKNITDDSRIIVYDTIKVEKFEHQSIVRIFTNIISKSINNIFYEIWKFNPHVARNLLNLKYELIGVDRTPTTQELVPPILARFFDGFDLNRNDRLEVQESEIFFKWVEENIIYRFDNESAVLNFDILSNAAIGDGRHGTEYWQTPYETKTEGFGDCEDMAILQMAFHSNFNISSKMGLVATIIPGEINHAIAIVKISDNVEDFIEVLGDIKYFEINGDFYMLVDNAYSNEFGTLGREPIKDTFKIYTTYLLEEAVLQDRIAREMKTFTSIRQ